MSVTGTKNDIKDMKFGAPSDPFVIGTPVVAPPPATGTCSDQSTLRAPATKVYGCPVGGRRRAVQASQNQDAVISWQMIDDEGRPIDLATCGTFVANDPATGEVRLRTREVVSFPGCPSDTQLNIVGTVNDVTTGVVTFPVGTAGTKYAGVFLAEAEVYSTTGSLRFVNQFYLIVNRSLTGDSSQVTGMPSIAELRLHLRDSGAADNPLLDDVQFDLAELAAAIEKPILYWNESPPPIDQRYTTTTFPHRYYWLEGAAAQLYLMAAHFYRRNRLPAQAGGITIDDLNKSAEYEQVGRQKWDEYKEWVLKKKVQLNAEACVQSQGSPYAYRGWW